MRKLRPWGNTGRLTWGTPLKLAAATLPAALLAAALVAPTTATAADLPDPAPTNVQLSWASDGSARIHVTWDETAARPNKIVVRDLDEARDLWTYYRTAELADSLDLDATAMRMRGRLQVVVTAGTKDGVTSPEGKSTVFDSYVADTVGDVVTQTATGMTVKARPWSPVDSNPGDPLDADDKTYEPKYEANHRTYSLGPASPSLEMTVTHPVPAYQFYFLGRSRWSDVTTGSEVYVNHARMSASMPARWQYGSEMPVTGSIGPLLGNNQDDVILQARNSPTSPWYVVTSTSAAYETGNFSFSFLAKTREYRIAMANSVTNNGGWSVFYGGYSAVMKSQAYQRVYALFTTPTIKVGQTSNVHVQLNVFLPSGLVALQRWNGKTWVFVQNIALKDNVGWAKVTGKAVGNSTYRIYSPNVTKDGMLVAAAYSPNFVLSTVR